MNPSRLRPLLRHCRAGWPVPFLLTLLMLPSVAGAQELSFQQLSAGKTLSGFVARAVYLDDVDRPMGGRFVHQRTGFTLDLLAIQSAPQAFIWVNSVPTSDMGEPHTQEHLLLGKGNNGRRHANLEGVSAASASAFTEQLRTCYHFHTAAGVGVFHQLFESQMDALLHPNYSDEEIRREVRNFGVAVNPADGKLRLEEKGTVYNEMVSSFERGWSRMGRAVDIAMYGPSHPLAFVSGGLPAAIREMKPEDIRRFHAANYQLWNMGMIASIPTPFQLEATLAQFDSALNRLQGSAPTKPAAPLYPVLPPPQSSNEGSVHIANYPSNNPDEPGPVIFSWGPTRNLDLRSRFLLELFLENIAGDATTNLYKLIVDPQTRKVDIGAKGVFGWVSSDLGNPVTIGLSAVAPRQMNPKILAQVRTLIVKEMERICTLPDSSPELLAFNDRVKNRIAGIRRSLRQFVNQPPGFGYRGSGSGWFYHLLDLACEDGFQKSLTRKEELAFVEKMLSEGTNLWRKMMGLWRLTKANPYIGAAKPSPELVAQEEAERRSRIDAEVASLMARYGVADKQEAIRRYGAEYDATTAQLDSVASLAPSAKLVSAPPMTLDDQINFSTEKITVSAADTIPLVASTFENLTGATMGLALNLRGVGQQDLLYLSMLPTLLTSVGVIDGGKPITHQEMSERLRAEISGLQAYISSNYRTGRCELVVRGSGGDVQESRQAANWMRLALGSPDWRAENLPRIREVVDQTLSNLRATMQGAEEGWVYDPAIAWMKQKDHLYMATNTFLTQAHNVLRLRWMLMDPGPDGRTVAEYLTFLGVAGGMGRGSVYQLLAALEGDTAALNSISKRSDDVADFLKERDALSEGGRKIVAEAVKDLKQMLNEVPDATLAVDWRYLCERMRDDLLVPPGEALKQLNNVRASIASRANARMFLTSSTETRNGLRPQLRQLAEALSAGGGGSQAGKPAGQAASGMIADRVASRTEGARPVFVGLVNPNTQGGVFINFAPGSTYAQTDHESLVKFLASKTYSGHGSHSIFMKTWGAGLAYSNGLRISANDGLVGYYAERCPELPQTLQFVIDELRRGPRNPAYVDYAIAQAFMEFRSASSYESRGEAIANDLADGLPPSTVRAFRQAILDLRSNPNLASEVFDQLPKVYGQVASRLQRPRGRCPGGNLFRDWSGEAAETVRGLPEKRGRKSHHPGPPVPPRFLDGDGVVIRSCVLKDVEMYPTIDSA
ncbi:MAG: hypothetical protein IPM61_13000 [Chlorobi bacterium]|nr:hypothetical protein [Chlorobiota bacterium]